MTMGNVGLRMNLLRTSNSMVTPTFIPWCKPPKLPSTEFNNKSHVLREARDKFIGPWCLHPLKWLVLFFFIQISLSLSSRLRGKAATTWWGAWDEAWESTTYSLCTTYVHLDTYDEPSKVWRDFEDSSAFGGRSIDMTKEWGWWLLVGVVWTAHKDGTCHISFVGREP